MEQRGERVKEGHLSTQKTVRTCLSSPQPHGRWRELWCRRQVRECVCRRGHNNITTSPSLSSQGQEQDGGAAFPASCRFFHVWRQKPNLAPRKTDVSQNKAWDQNIWHAPLLSPVHHCRSPSVPNVQLQTALLRLRIPRGAEHQFGPHPKLNFGESKSHCYLKSIFLKL
jgi:hypothetical protein